MTLLADTVRRCKSAWHLHHTQASPVCPRCGEGWK